MRTLSEILIDVEAAQSQHQIVLLADELMQNKYRYSLTELSFAKEVINNNVARIMDNDFAALKESGLVEIFKHIFDGERD